VPFKVTLAIGSKTDTQTVVVRDLPGATLVK
jgi:hypothetical protein